MQTYKYDSLNRITEAREVKGTNQTWIQSFGYDKYGNRNSFAQTIGSQQLVTNNQNFPQVDANTTTNRFATGQGYGYDKNGNITSDPTAGNRTFTFDGDNKQTEVKTPSGVLIGKYFYDGEGKRVKKQTYDTYGAVKETTVFVYSSGKAKH